MLIYAIFIVFVIFFLFTTTMLPFENWSAFSFLKSSILTYYL